MKSHILFATCLVLMIDSFATGGRRRDDEPRRNVRAQRFVGYGAANAGHLGQR